MSTPGPRWQRRKEARPAEIIEAALAIFAERGFAAAKLEDIARRAGVAKASLYLYFPTKEDLFRAGVRSALTRDFAGIFAAAEAFDGRFATLAPRLLLGIAGVFESGQLAGLIKMVIGESHNFPDLARIWHDGLLEAGLGALSGIIARAQQRGEVRAGDPRLHAFSLLGPMLMAGLFRNVFADVSDRLPDLKALALQHGGNVLHGMIIAQDGGLDEL